MPFELGFAQAQVGGRATHLKLSTEQSRSWSSVVPSSATAHDESCALSRNGRPPRPFSQKRRKRWPSDVPRPSDDNRVKLSAYIDPRRDAGRRRTPIGFGVPLTIK